MAAANHTFGVPIPHTRWNLPVRSAGHLKPNRCGSRLALAVAFYLMLDTAAHADLPLTIEDLIADQGTVRLNLALNYANSERDGLSLVPTGSNSYISVPTKNNSDILIGSLSLGYGLMRDTEIYGRGSYLYSNTRTNNLDKINTTEDNRLLDAWVGVNYQFKKDDATPALLGFAEAAALEEHLGTSNFFKSWMVGFTTYRTIDPVVFSFTSGYLFNLIRKAKNRDYRPGNYLFLNPAVDFAMNDHVTLTTGMQWVIRKADRYDGEAQDFRRTSTDLKLGVGYGVSKDDIAQATFTVNASGNGGSSLQLNWQHTF